MALQPLAAFDEEEREAEESWTQVEQWDIVEFPGHPQRWVVVAVTPAGPVVWPVPLRDGRA